VSLPNIIQTFLLEYTTANGSRRDLRGDVCRVRIYAMFGTYFDQKFVL
jgi:hypothetical protein